MVEVEVPRPIQMQRNERIRPDSHAFQLSHASRLTRRRDTGRYSPRCGDKFGLEISIIFPDAAERHAVETCRSPVRFIR